MEQLQQALITSFNAQLTSGAIQKTIDKRVAEFVESTIKDTLCSYGDVAKALKTKLQEDLCARLGDLSLQEYNDLLLSLLKERIQAVYVGDAQKHATKILDEFFKKPKPKWKLSEIIEEIFEEPDDPYETRCSLFVDDREHIVFVDFDGETNKKNSYECEFHLVIADDGKLIRAQRRTGYGREKKDIKPDGGGLRDRETLLFQILAHGCSIEVDESNALSVARFDG